MKLFFYPRLALVGMSKNRRLYLPYILSCIGMIMMSYILMALSESELLEDMAGGTTLKQLISMGVFVILIFAVLFLFYTNSFLSRRRNKEFGLYGVLGMGRAGIGRIIFWESLFVSLIGLIGGIGLGVLFCKFAELGLANATQAEVNYQYTVSLHGIVFTLEVYLCIFLLITVKSLLQVRKYKPLDLLLSERTGEKPPKSNWILALAGAIILGVAYYMAVTIKTPLTALSVFFVAVILVIIATYLLFISGSVVLCRILQRNKKYYYKKQHFVSVSSMAYRMKRNGAGLASICILSIMVLVMISSTTTLYFGMNEVIRSLGARSSEIVLGVGKADFKDEKFDMVRAGYENAFSEIGIKPENLLEYKAIKAEGILDGDRLTPDMGIGFTDFDNTRQVIFIGASDYNEAVGANIRVGEGEAAIGTLRCEYDSNKIDAFGMQFRLTQKVEMVPTSDRSVNFVPYIMLVVPDTDDLKHLEELEAQGMKMLDRVYYYGYDTSCDEADAIALIDAQFNFLARYEGLEEGYSYSSTCVASEAHDFIVTYGGLFFIGIMLSIVFIFAAAVIIYYKQISEGYEDRSRFDIMQNVGMTKDDIKRSINSQVLTVFFAPLIMAGLHLGFAFPVIWKLLQLFGLNNLRFAIMVTIIAFLCFGLFYALIYKVTARAYYSIVSAARHE